MVLLLDYQAPLVPQALLDQMDELVSKEKMEHLETLVNTLQTSRDRLDHQDLQGLQDPMELPGRAHKENLARRVRRGHQVSQGNKEAMGCQEYWEMMANPGRMLNTVHVLREHPSVGVPMNIRPMEAAIFCKVL